MLAAGTLLAATAVAAVAAPASGGQFGYDGSSTKASTTGTGPSSPTLGWFEVLEDHDVPGGTVGELTFDSVGHVLFQGRDEAADPDQDVLVAVNRDDGTVAWELEGVSRNCGVAASDDGRIFASLGNIDSNTRNALAVIDAASGQITQTYDPTTEGGEAFGGCSDSLRLTDDGMLIALGSADFAARMQGFTTTDGLSLAWTRQYNVDGAGADGENTSELARPVISTDGDGFYLCREEPEAFRPDSADDLLLFQKLDPATGNLVDEVAIQESATCQTRGVVAVDGGAVVATDSHSTGHHLIRIEDAGSTLSVAWDTLYSRDEGEDESGIDNYPAASISHYGGHVLFRGAGGGWYHAVEATTGELVWSYRASSFPNAYENVAIDAAGNAYVSTFGADVPVESFNANGHTRWTAPPGSELYGTDGVSDVKFVTVGPDGGVFIRANTTDGVALARIVDSGERPAPVAREIGDTCDDHQDARYSDVSDENVHQYTIRCAGTYEISKGTGDGSTFSPQRTLTKGQTASFLVNLLRAAGQQVPQDAPQACGPDGRTIHTDNVEALISVGAIADDAANCAAAEAIDRGRMAAWTHGAVEYGLGRRITTEEDFYSDDAGQEFEDEINAITSIGLVTGKGDGTFGPGETLRRAPMATFLSRGLDVVSNG